MDEMTLRLAVFFGLFGAFALAETVTPRRQRNFKRWGRWFTNWAISISNTVLTGVLKAVLGVTAALAALDAANLGVGLFNHLSWPFWLEVLIVFVVLDFAIWLQHLLSHKIPILWRLHRVHHADRDFDVTTAIRFHPIEIGLSMLFKVALVYALGAPVEAVILFEIVLNGAAMFNHANIRLPFEWDRRLRQVIVTPDMHRVHHSVYRHEHDTNYGFNLSIWDRMFKTYTAQPRHGHEDMTIGLAEHQSPEPTQFLWSLAFPFRR
ncbi:MAG: sterol desaturase family protein [Pseudomonadota bacterium]